MKFNLAGNFFSSIAPKEISMAVPFTSLLTSDSSTLPSKIILLISAIEAIVVPALKLLLCITWSPSFTGISNIVPDI